MAVVREPGVWHAARGQLGLSATVFRGLPWLTAVLVVGHAAGGSGVRGWAWGRSGHWGTAAGALWSRIGCVSRHPRCCLRVRDVGCALGHLPLLGCLCRTELVGERLVVVSVVLCCSPAVTVVSRLFRWLSGWHVGFLAVSVICCLFGENGWPFWCLFGPFGSFPAIFGSVWPMGALPGGSAIFCPVRRLAGLCAVQNGITLTSMQSQSRPYKGLQIFF